MKFRKFHFRFSYIVSKDVEFNFSGRPKEDFQDPSMFVYRNSIFDLFDQKWPARMVTVKTHKANVNHPNHDC